MTGSWDKTIRYWDGRTSNPCKQITLPERLYCADVIFPLAVVGTADRNIIIYDIRKAEVEYKRIMSPLKFQSRCIACFPDKTGFALGSIEGRVAIHHIEDKDSHKNFAFRCHRDGANIFSINALSFHPLYSTFATCGSDGTFHFWDKDSKQRLKAFLRCPLPISDAKFNADGSLFAYACSYDWSKGVEGYNMQQPQKNYIFLHTTPEDEIKSRAGNRKKR